MNNDEQIKHIDSKFEKLDRDIRIIHELLMSRMRVAYVLLEESECVKTLQIMQIQESSEGLVIRVK